MLVRRIYKSGCLALNTLQLHSAQSAMTAESEKGTVCKRKHKKVNYLHQYIIILTEDALSAL